MCVCVCVYKNITLESLHLISIEISLKSNIFCTYSSAPMSQTECDMRSIF